MPETPVSQADTPAAPPAPAKKTILSATSVKGFLDCSWLYYQMRILKVPDWTHPKTYIGSLAHAILEAFCRPKHRKHYVATIHHQSVYGSPAIARMVRLFREKHPDVTDEHISHLDNLVFVALNHDWMCKGAKRVLPPEHPFEIDFGDFAIRGFMDRVVLYDERAVIRDYKSQSKRFTEDQISWNLQAFFYQMAVKHEFGLRAAVEFLLLRFPPNKRDSQRYIQTVPELTEAQMEGFKHYLAYLNQAIQTITLESAKTNLKCYSDEGFCIRVCSLKDPFDYWVLLGDAERPLASTRIPSFGIGERDPDEWATEQLRPKAGQRVEKRRYNGCTGFYTDEGRRRNFR
jgi:hypothetical protein